MITFLLCVRVRRRTCDVCDVRSGISPGQSVTLRRGINPSMGTDRKEVGKRFYQDLTLDVDEGRIRKCVIKEMSG